jgi:hypothetical protein
MALLEATELDHRDGRILNANMADYLVPVTADITALDATFLPGEDTLADPLGVKGLAELVFVGVPAHCQRGVQRQRSPRHRPTDHPGQVALIFRRASGKRG